MPELPRFTIYGQWDYCNSIVIKNRLDLQLKVKHNEARCQVAPSTMGEQIDVQDMHIPGTGMPPLQVDGQSLKEMDGCILWKETQSLGLKLANQINCP